MFKKNNYFFEFSGEYIPKEYIIECIYASNGSLCEKECELFNRCWPNKSKLEEKIIDEATD